MKRSAFDLNSPQLTRRLLVLVLLGALLLTFWSLSSHLWDKYSIVRDVQNFYWMARAQDPTLFATDYLYISAGSVIEIDVLGFHLLLQRRSPGYGLLFYLTSIALDYIWLTKLSILVLASLCVIYLFKFGHFLRGNLTGISLSMLFIFFILASPQSISLATGLQRAFAVPLLILFVYYMVRNRYVIAGLVILMGALIYVPVFPLMVLVYIFSFVKIEESFKVSLNISWLKVMVLAGTLLVSSSVIFLILSAQLGLFRPAPSPLLSTTFERTTISEDPVFQSEGSTPLFYGFPFLGRAGVFDMGADVTNFLVLLILSILVYKTVGSPSLRRVPRELWYLLGAGFIMYAASLFFVFSLSSFALYLPSRYTRVTLILVFLYFVGLNWVDFLKELPGWLVRNIRLFIFFVFLLALALGIVYAFSPNRALLIPTLWLVGLIFIGVLVPILGSILFWLVVSWGLRPENPRLNNVVKWSSLLVFSVVVFSMATIYVRVLGLKPHNSSEPQREVYQFVASLPNEAVLAGTADMMEGIPLFAKRSVLYRKLFPRRSAPIIEYFDTQYTETPQPILDFCQRYHVSYLVLDIRDFAPDYMAKEEFFYQPWNDEIVKRVAGRSNFVLPQMEPVFTSGPYKVIKCDAETLLDGNSSE